MVTTTKTKKSVAKKADAVIKKVVAKVAPKKNLKDAKRVLVCANGEQCFWTTDGTIISNLVELRDALETMADAVFDYHVSNKKNDFADWIQYVLGDTELAGKFRKTKKASTARTVIVSRLKIYDI